jgi:histidine triad (HIT) family protein
MPDCIFCKIVSGQIPAAKVYEDENILVFKDVTPQAPVHLLAIPKDHYASVHDVPADKMHIMTDLFSAVNAVVNKLDLCKNGYRLVINSGAQAGQAVPHIHVHILAGRDMSWPPG